MTHKKVYISYHDLNVLYYTPLHKQAHLKVRFAKEQNVPDEGTPIVTKQELSCECVQL